MTKKKESINNEEVIELGEKEKLTAYLNEMQEGELFQTKFERTDNFVIDSILSYKLQEADRLGIETKMDVKVPKDLNVSAYVLTGILTKRTYLIGIGIVLTVLRLNQLEFVFEECNLIQSFGMSAQP